MSEGPITRDDGNMSAEVGGIIFEGGPSGTRSRVLFRFLFVDPLCCHRPHSADVRPYRETLVSRPSLMF